MHRIGRLGTTVPWFEARRRAKVAAAAVPQDWTAVAANVARRVSRASTAAKI